MEEDEDKDKYDSINDYYLQRIKYPYMFKNNDEIEKDGEEEEEEEEEENEQKEKEDKQEKKDD